MSHSSGEAFEKADSLRCHSAALFESNHFEMFKHLREWFKSWLNLNYQTFEIARSPTEITALYNYFAI